MNKYISYLKLKHSWKKINCFTLIIKIYKELLDIELKDTLKRINTNCQDDIDKKWYRKYTKEVILKEAENWQEIKLEDIKEFDILVFMSHKERQFHFGMYIEQNKFIHCQEGCYTTFSELDDEWRDMILGIYRHGHLV